jgi:hypothetical protein
MFVTKIIMVRAVDARAATGELEPSTATPTTYHAGATLEPNGHAAIRVITLYIIHSTKTLKMRKLGYNRGGGGGSIAQLSPWVCY